MAQQHTTQATERNPRHTSPWMRSEYVPVNGHELVYSLTQGGLMTVHLPGRRSASADVLKAMGHDVVMPKVLRTAEAS